MANKVGDICFKTGTYEKGGETKNRYLKGGVLFQGDDGSFYGIIEAVPVGVEGRFSVFGDKPQGQKQNAPTTPYTSNNEPLPY